MSICPRTVFCVCMLAVCAAALYIAPIFFDDPMKTLAACEPSKIWYDINGKAIVCERGNDSQWRFPVKLCEISDDVKKTVLATEDASFYSHGAVNWFAVLRATFQNVSSLKIVSGASTISMQLAGLILPRKSRSIFRKFKQTMLAEKLESEHSKDEIFCEYLNSIPFGGKIYGIEAAAKYYFGLHASELNAAEASFLCGIPQKPNKYRPDRHFAAARQRQRRVLDMLVSHDVMKKDDAEKFFRFAPLRLRDFRYAADFQLMPAAEYTHALKRATSEISTSPFATTLERETQNFVLQALRSRLKSLRGVDDAAAVVIYNKDISVRAYVGTVDFFATNSGQVDAANARRSAGSALKPFIYAEAIEGGLIVAGTKILDAPIRSGIYAPTNYDGKFLGMTSVAYALSHSLNTPAVRLVEELGQSRVGATFERLGLVGKKCGSENLTMALGTMGHTLFDITAAYCTLARGGMYAKPHFAADTKSGEKFVFTSPTCAMISEILCERPIPNSQMEIAWKTGTSNNNCDAWCFAYTPDFTVGIWFGNKDGRCSDKLVGADVAAPAAGEIMEFLYRNNVMTKWPKNEFFKSDSLCAESGLEPTPLCKNRTRQTVIDGRPLRSCNLCGKTSQLRIISPLPAEYKAESATASVRLKLESTAENPQWYLNGTLIGENIRHYDFKCGKTYILRVVEKNDFDNATLKKAEIRFSVIVNKQDSSKIKRINGT